MKNIILHDNMIDEKGVIMFEANTPYTLVKGKHIVNQGGIAYRLESIWVEYTIEEVVEITFIEWYYSTRRDSWHEDYAYLYEFASDMADEYEEWCKENNQKPTWDG